MSLTREAAAAKARHVLGVDVVEAYPHPELEDDLRCGGFAFTAGGLGAVVGHDGGYQTSVLEAAGETIETLVIGWLVEQRHRYGVDDPAPPRAAPGATHPCPVCGTPTAHDDRHPRSVCPACQARATDRDGRRVVAYNEGFAGGLIVFYAESDRGPQSEVAGEVLESRTCFIDGRACRLGEGRFGGVVVELLDA